jgi:hypothetical protein
MMTKPHPSAYEPSRAERDERRADLTVRTVIWIVGGLVVVALSLWWFLT